MEQSSSRAALRMIVAPLVTAKVISLLVPLLVVWTTSTGNGFPSIAELTNAFNQWDSQSYVTIAERGYPTTTADPHTVYLAAFLPGYPMLMRLVAPLIGDTVAAGLIISLTAETAAMYYLARLVLAERNKAACRFTLWLFALWPFAFFFSAVYTESTFVACAAAALYYARRGDNPRACVAASLSCAVRVTGVALVPALAWELLVRTRRPTIDRGGGRRGPAARWMLLNWGAIALVPAPLVGYGAYMQVHAHDALAFFAAQRSPSFNHHFAAPWTGFLATLSQVDHHNSAGNTYIFGVEVLFGCLGALVCAALLLHRRFPFSITIYCTAVLLMATCISFWLSVPRYELAMFPALIALSDLTRRRLELRAGIISVSCALMAFGATLYSSGRWLG